MNMYHIQIGKKLLDQYKHYHHTDNDSISSRDDLLKILIEVFLRKRQVHKGHFVCIVRAPQMLAAFRGKARYFEVTTLIGMMLKIKTNGSDLLPLTTTLDIFALLLTRWHPH